ncbi:hypothetical protein [Silvimonas soli]|uniref:hypothetical protein n=1 Tax=Silvimonas soli TaxID=2980100 RepID=UPI0024B3672A|nr:hypothetical protein [Silvimonas soli]
MRPLISAVLCYLLHVTVASAQINPGFADYSVTVIPPNKPAQVQLADAQSRRYASRLREAGHSKPNFAGHYVLASWGCGASCQMTAAIDAKTGSVIWLPFTVCCWDINIQQPLEFKTNSRLLIVHGARNERGNGTYFYEFDGKRFKLLAERTKPAT